MTLNLITATAQEFEPFIGSTFQVETDKGNVVLVLDNIKIRENASIRDQPLEIGGVTYPPRYPFALTFTGPRNQILQPQTYRVHHDTLGEMDIFISAFRQDHDYMLYESTFT